MSAPLLPPPGIEGLPSLPLPWRPMQRIEASNDLFANNLKSGLVSMDALRDYSNDIQERYIITDVGIRAVDLAIGYTSIGADVFFGRERTERDPYEVQREFEHEMLGLTPTDSNGGLRFWELRSGFAGGQYPVEPFAELVGADPVTFREVLTSDSVVKFGNAILHFSNYIVPVFLDERNPDIIHADMITELSKEGIALVDTALWISDLSTTPLKKD